MKIINTYNQIKFYFSNGCFDYKKWEKYIGSVSNEIKMHCEKDVMKYDFNSKVLPVLNAALNNAEKMKQVNDSFETIVNDLSIHINQIFDKEIDLTIVLYLGLCNSAGKAFIENGENTILLGIEKIIELDWCDKLSMNSLIYHELGHIWHKVCGNLYPFVFTHQQEMIIPLYQEGIAMTCEYLCTNQLFYRNDKNGWLTWCFENESLIRQEYWRRICDGESIQDFFGDWCSFMGHSDTGYFLGYQFIQFLLKRYTLKETANLSADVLIKEFKKMNMNE